MSSPYFQKGQQDNFTLDHFQSQHSNDYTAALMEVFLWEAQTKNGASQPEDSLLPEASSSSPAIIRLNPTPDNAEQPDNYYGFGIQCRVTTAVGTAHLSPGTRQFTDFVAEEAASKISDPDFYILPWLYPVQIQAMTALAAPMGDDRISNKALTPVDTYSDQSTWQALHSALQSTVVEGANSQGQDDGIMLLPLLDPNQTQQAMYKLLGESMIAMMDEGGIDPWYGELYNLKSAKWLVNGPVPAKPILALLALWAAICSGGALWILIFAGPRWAPSLSGYELFKFGGRYTSQTAKLNLVDLQAGVRSLKEIPGMVGLLTSETSAICRNADDVDQSTSCQIVGLSRVRADLGVYGATRHDDHELGKVRGTYAPL